MEASQAYAALAERMGYPSSARFRNILEFIMTPDQARMAVELPCPPEELSPRVGLPVDKVNAELDLLYQKGVIMPRNFETRETYRFARGMGQLHDISQSHWNLDVYNDVQLKQLFELWEDFVRKEWEPDRMPQLMEAQAPRQRVIPAFKAIASNPNMIPADDIREIAKQSYLVAVVSCACRKRKEVVVTHCNKSHDVNCLQFDRSAEYAVNRGHGRKLSLDEAITMLGEIEDDGLVHCWTNSTKMTGNTLCSCCVDCCMNFLPMSEYGVPYTKVYQKSRYQANIEQDACSGCQDCVDRCQFDAIEMRKVEGSKKFKAFVIPENCMGCGVCPLVCETEALTMELVRSPEWIPQPATV